MKRLYFFLSLMILALTSGAQMVTDVINTSTFSSGGGDVTLESGNSYTSNASSSWLGVAFNVTTGTGIVATKTGGVFTKLTVTFGSFSGANSTVNIYGSHTPFEISDMFSGNNCELIGTIAKSSGILTFESADEFEYVGFRSASGLIYLTNLTIEYDNTPVDLVNPKVKYTVGTGGTLKVTLPDDEGEVVESGKNVLVGKTILFEAAANKGYAIEGITVNGIDVAPAVNKSSYSFSLTALEATPLKVTVNFKAVDAQEATIIYSAGQGGTLTAVDCTDYLPLESGQKVKTLHTVAFVATPEEGYTIENFTVNGEVVESPVPGQNMTNLMLDIVENTEVSVTFTGGVSGGSYCNNYEGKKNSRTDRYLGAFTLTSGDETLNVTNIQNSSGSSNVYNDKTDDVFEIEPGQEVNFKVTQASGEWMHGYLWIDWNRDGEFTPVFDGNKVADESELVSFTFYSPTGADSGYDSTGKSTKNGGWGYDASYGYSSKANLNFTVPENLAYGDYRLRYIIAWNNINPCGPELNDNDPLTTAGGSITDITLRYADPNPKPEEVIIRYGASEGGTVTAVDCNDFIPVKIGQKVKYSHVVAFVATPEEGYMIDRFTVNGEEAESPVPGQELTNLMITVTEDTEVNVSFIPDPNQRQYCNNYEGMKKTGSDNGARYLGSLTLSCGDETLKLSNLQNSGQSDIYIDRTDEVLEIRPGQTVTVKSGDTNSSWMHGYVWVDWNRDREFTAEISGNAVTANSELVAYNFYGATENLGYDSTGKYVQNSVNGYNTTFIFTVPAELAAGDYRLRYIVAWNNINPCGPELSDKDRLDKQGGSITDVTLRCVNPNSAPAAGLETIEAAEEAAPVYYNLQGVRVANPSTGVYIRVVGDKAEKVYLRK